MKIGYMRECAAGPTLAEQEALLRQAGIEDFSRHAPVYVDKRRKGPAATTPERDKMLRALRPGDLVVIAKASRLGTACADVLGAMADITALGASIYDVDAGEAVQLHPDAARAIAFAERAERGAKREQAARMRARKVALARPAAARSAFGARPRLPPRRPGPISPRPSSRWRSSST